MSGSRCSFELSLLRHGFPSELPPRQYCSGLRPVQPIRGAPLHSPQSSWRAIEALVLQEDLPSSWGNPMMRASPSVCRLNALAWTETADGANHECAGTVTPQDESLPLLLGINFVLHGYHERAISKCHGEYALLVSLDSRLVGRLHRSDMPLYPELGPAI